MDNLDNDSLLEKFFDISKNLSSENEKYLVSVLERLLRISGPSKKEKEVLQYVEDEITKHSKDVKTLSNADFGLLVVVPALKTPKYSILLDAHVDTVLTFLDENYIEPEYRVRKETDRVLIKGTGLDNRIHVGLLMTLIRFVRFEEIEYCALFSTEEENGKSNLDLIIVLDVVQGTLEDKRQETQSEIKINDLPVIGKGTVPLNQNFGDYPYNSRSNIYGFWDYGSVHYLNTPKIRIGVPCCYMHSKISYASISDLFDLMKFFASNFEKEFISTCCDILNPMNDCVQKSVRESMKKMEKLETEEEEWYDKYIQKKKDLSSFTATKESDEEYEKLEREVEDMRNRYRDSEYEKNELLLVMNKSSGCFLKNYIEKLRKDESVTLPPLLSCITH